MLEAFLSASVSVGESPMYTSYLWFQFPPSHLRTTVEPTPMAPFAGATFTGVAPGSGRNGLNSTNPVGLTEFHLSSNCFTKKLKNQFAGSGARVPSGRLLSPR